tara:strand:+ start:200 stop:946 length:747 start_codon:yes stop_codon:yes gene_type:complete
MGRQPFRQLKSDATAKTADDSASVTLPSHGMKIKRLLDTTTSTSFHVFRARMPIHPLAPNNSFNSANLFFFARKIYFVPLYSASGGVIEHLIPTAGSGNATSGVDDYKLAIYDGENGGLPKTLLSNTVQWTPAGDFNFSYLDMTNTSGGELTLDADRWYWIAVLGASATNNGNVSIGCFSANRGGTFQLPGISSPAMNIYYDPGNQTSMPSSITMTGNNKFFPNSNNNIPRFLMGYKVQSSDNFFKGA